ncbi:unnamed protein product [Protopolystoma xenopodis]|uniref:Malectin domain-containing protein n=1 Tax=Protopolystoma xenopodis TaxID=117903 RepID=A0A3S5ABM4_9PLAT|nr:unnamed protein product [Protopolystoma xenopodis]
MKGFILRFFEGIFYACLLKLSFDMPLRLHFFSVVLLLSFRTCSTYDVIFAINCGGGAHVDSNGISYDPDTLETGIASSHGLSLAIMRVNELDRRLYQTERYSTDSFSYKLPVPPDGDYVLVLKFSEVWFRDPGQKVFDVKINDDISLIKNLDIYASVGFATAHDERFQLKFLNGNLYVQDESTVLSVDHFTVDFKKGARDNPKINAILLLRGYLDGTGPSALFDFTSKVMSS